MNDKQKDTLRVLLPVFDKLVAMAVKEQGLTVTEAIVQVRKAIVEGVK